MIVPAIRAYVVSRAKELGVNPIDAARIVVHESQVLDRLEPAPDNFWSYRPIEYVGPALSVVFQRKPSLMIPLTEARQAARELRKIKRRQAQKAARRTRINNRPFHKPEGNDQESTL